ncbi:DNA-processing protein DprA [Acinetobacter larvae]|uniref:DNA protecting protein DprA n=1 Tax=Acinetobacter larvae TaxID=1789224 RepID=A0A1B2M2T5_9GAMM|nr:DNA-processing protein DprA [Acinetobacter larvae]AOA59505.1 DNA protecting protein DprA [Acinetobacter larvae]
MLDEISDCDVATIRLWYLVQHSIHAYRKLLKHFGSALEATSSTALSHWSTLQLHQGHIQRAQQFKQTEGQVAFQRCLEQVQQHTDHIVTEQQRQYPQQLSIYSDRPPILFIQGAWQNLSQPQIAIVGSRKASPHGKQVAYDFAYYLSEKGFFINSGLAQGIDEAAHLGALAHQRTMAVVATGLDSTYPSQNQQLKQKILQNAGSIISEYLPLTLPLQHHFPRRNRIVSGLSLGVLVAEAKHNSGSLITAQAAAEQGKVTFAIPGHIYAEHHQGCHQLIREGAILVDHPEQIIEDLALPTQWQCQQQNEQPITPTQIPEHLYLVYQQLDWIGQDLDQLAIKLEMNVAQLTAALMELELIGVCIQQSGLYLRCRMSH